ncbi:MAG: hypothetical protein SGPRY_008845 [Prymnesium sp.]
MLSLLSLGALALQLPSPPSIGSQRARSAALLMSAPATIGEAKERFQAALGPYQTTAMPTQSFINSMLTQQFALVSPTYRYSRIYSVGFEFLCKAYLPITCRTPEDVEKVRKALYIAMDMDPAQCKTDSEELLAFAEGKSEEELLASPDFASVKEAPFKYSLQFGAGLIALMKAVGVEPGEESIKRWCSALDLPNAGSLTRDWEFFNLQMGKLETFQEMILQMNAAAKRNEAARLKAKAEAAAKEANDAEAEAAASEKTETS